MKVSYKKLWKLLIDKEMKKTDLITVAGINQNILARMGKGEYVSMESLHKICKALDCDVGDICVLNDKSNEENDEEIDKFLPVSIRGRQ
ncbi:MAG: helix-turn-helix transcriptional regulator [Treponema sp.]|nr:helix-turn-helix transcriptional regulator [Treponema sp.]